MGDFMKTTGGCALGIAIFLIMIFIAVFFIEGGVWLSTKILPWLSLVMWVVFLLDLFIILPLGAIRKAKAMSGLGLYISSYVYGLTLWLWALLLAYVIWGFQAVFIGLVLAGVGVAPVALLATAFKGEWWVFAQLLLLIFLTFGSRALGLYFVQKAEELTYDIEVID